MAPRAPRLNDSNTCSPVKLEEWESAGNPAAESCIMGGNHQGAKVGQGSLLRKFKKKGSLPASSLWTNRGRRDTRVL